MATLQRDVFLSGIGLHTGKENGVTLRPGKPGGGRTFRRLDVKSQPQIAARWDGVEASALCTTIRQNGHGIKTCEHLLAALVALGVDDVEIAVDGEEIPLLDGSALPWCEALVAAGVAPQPEDFSLAPVIQTPHWIHDGDRFVAALPSPETCFTYGIDFPYGPIGQQWYSWYPQRESFMVAIAPARTFGFADQVAQLQAAGLIQGGSLDNALVCDRDRWLNPPLRFPDEPVRHKLLDLIGDLSLLGTLPQGHIIAHKASHTLHHQLAQRLASLYSEDI